MKVFISWSGQSSRAAAEALDEWLQLVVNKLQPWISSNDIDPGTRWSAAVAKALSETKVGIICLTPENVTAPWILFEAGALAKTMEGTFVCPYLLFDLRDADLPGPLKQFQSLQADKDGTNRLVSVLNKALGRGRIDKQQLDHAFRLLWPDLSRRLLRIQQIQNQFRKTDTDPPLTPGPGSARGPRGPKPMREIIKELYLKLKDQPAPLSEFPPTKNLRKQTIQPFKIKTS